MTKRTGNHNHYERMFETYLLKNNFLYIAINEGKRPRLNGKGVKNFDFIVFSKNGLMLIDIKGKEFPSPSTTKNYFENWVWSDDVSSLHIWEKKFGGNAKALLVFPYLINHKKDNPYFKERFKFKRNHYGLVGIEANNYRINAHKARGEGRINISRGLNGRFASLVKPLSYFLK